MTAIRTFALWGLLAMSPALTVYAQTNPFGSGAAPSFPAGRSEYPATSRMGGGGMSAGPMKPQLVRRTVTESIMVPISPEELAEMQEYQSALQVLRADDRTDEQKAAAKEALAKLVEKQFTRDLETREKEITELEARTKKLREQFEKRKTAKAEIIALRLKTLQNEIDGLGFPGGAGMAPRGGGTSPGFAPGASYDPALPNGLQPAPDPNSAAPSYSPFSPADYPSTRRPATRDEFESDENSRSPGSSRTRPTLDDEPELKDTTSFKNESFDPLDEAAGSVPVAAKSLILNGDFEMFDRQEDRAEYWDNLAPQGSEQKRVAGQGIDGTAAFLIRNAETFGDSQSVVSREIPFTGNSLSIRFSAQVKCKADKRAVMRIRFINEQDMSQSVEPDLIPNHESDQWVRYACEARVPKGTKKIIFSLENHGPGDVWLDDLRAYFFEDSTSENLLQNSSMEELTRASSEESPEAADWKQGQAIPGVDYATDKKGGNNGSGSLRISKTDNRYFPIAEYTQTINHTGDAPVIQLSASVKTENATKAILDVLFLDDKGEWIKHEWAAYIGDQNAEPKPLTHDWKEYKGAVAIPAGTKQIVIGLQDYGPGTVWFDDVSAVYLKELPQEPTNVPR